MSILRCFAIVLFAVAAIAQSNETVFLVDEFDDVPCDDFLARIDNFYNQLNNHPESDGYLVITGSNELLRAKLTTELLFESAVGWRGFDRTRTKIVRGAEMGPFRVKLWMVKKGAETPNFEETRWDLRFSPGSEPFLLRSDMSQICDPPPLEQVAKELLEANDDGSLYVVVHGPTAKARRAELRRARKLLAPLKTERIRFFLRKSYAAYSDYHFSVGRHERSEFKSFF